MTADFKIDVMQDKKRNQMTLTFHSKIWPIYTGLTMLLSEYS